MYKIIILYWLNFIVYLSYIKIIVDENTKKLISYLRCSDAFLKYEYF